MLRVPTRLLSRGHNCGSRRARRANTGRPNSRYRQQLMIYSIRSMNITLLDIGVRGRQLEHA